MPQKSKGTKTAHDVLYIFDDNFNLNGFKF